MSHHRSRKGASDTPEGTARKPPKKSINLSLNAASPCVLLSLVLVYMIGTVFSVYYLVRRWDIFFSDLLTDATSSNTLTMPYLMMAPVSLAIFMYVWLCVLAWPLRGQFNTVSSSCAQQEHNFLRIILVVLCCLLGTSMAAILVDEFNSRNRRPSDSNFIIFEVVACLMLPLTGMFPTVDIPDQPLRVAAWGEVNTGTPNYPVRIHGVISFMLHFFGVLPFMFGLPLINLWYAFADPPESWVYLVSVLTLGCLVTFLFFQMAIIFKKAGIAFTAWSKDQLFLISYVAELLLVLFVSLFTLLFSLKRNENIPFDFKLDYRVHTVVIDVVSSKLNVSSWAELQERLTMAEWRDLLNATLSVRKSQLHEFLNATLENVVGGH